MNKFGRLILVQPTLLVMPTRITICLDLPSWPQQTMIRIMKAFLWAGTDMIQGEEKPGCMDSRAETKADRWAGGFGPHVVRTLPTQEVALAAASGD
jgi:hypothetical protein